MLNNFKQLKGFFSIKQVCIDNFIFRLHYRATAFLFFACSILVTSRQIFGDPISCITEGIPQKVMESYCWIESTFTLPDRFNKRLGVEVPHPGVGNPIDDEEVRYHKYYQWVCFMLFLQAVCFYMPHHIWKTFESNRIRNLVKKLYNPILDNKTRDEQIDTLTSYLRENFGQHNSYFYRFFSCELLNLANVIAQIFLIDRFLDYEFSSYGSEVLQFVELEPEVRNDPMTRIFPKVTKCTFHKYGPTGSIQKFDSLCVLPLNIINEKIYVVLWFWMIFIAIISALSIIYRCFILAFPQFRLQILRLKSRSVRFSSLCFIVENGNVGDWFVLLQLARNIDPLSFNVMIQKAEQKLAERTDKKTFIIDLMSEKEGKDEPEMFKIEKVDDFQKF